MNPKTFAAVEIYGPHEMPPAFHAFPTGPVLAPDAPSALDATAHLLVRDADAAPIARCSVWAQNTPQLHGTRTGYIGHYAARAPVGPAHIDPVHIDSVHIDPVRAAGDLESISALLDAACRQLQQAGCAWAIGPIDGSTFRSYRFVTERNLQSSHLNNHHSFTPRDILPPPFFLEPDHPDAWPHHFQQAGFAPLAHYTSAIGPLMDTDPGLEILQQRGQNSGAQLRAVDLTRFEDELARVYAVILGSFSKNFLYTPISAAEFMAQFLPVRAYLHPELVWLAEKAGRLVGFIFCVPDLAQAQRGEAVDTVIIKTVGVLPDAGVLGLGNWLTAHCQQAAYGLGYRRVIHALMHDDNISNKISRRYAQPMRGYTLYSKALSTA